MQVYRTFNSAQSGWRTQGYTVKLIFLCLPTVEQAVTRVRLRISQGGHAIPPEVIARRFRAGLQNLETLYKPLVDDRAL